LGPSGPGGPGGTGSPGGPFGSGSGSSGAVPFGGAPASAPAGAPQPFGATQQPYGGAASPFGATPQPFGAPSAENSPFGMSGAAGQPTPAGFGQAFQPATPPPSPQEQSSLGQAFEFVKRNILQDHGKQYPIYMVIGLPGSGKTTYLAMLGDILKMKNNKYFFPYARIDTRRVLVQDYAEQANREQIRELAARILDLPTDYSEEFYEKYIKKMYWAAQTQPEISTAGDAKPSTYFLVADITRDKSTIAKIVTVETSGEDFAAVLDIIQRADLEADRLTPMQRILLTMMDLSEGYVILFSPENPTENDRHFQNLFNMINTYIEPRALQVVMNQALTTMAVDTAGKSEQAGLGPILERIRRLELLKQQVTDRRNGMYREYETRLKELNERLKVAGLDAISNDESKFLDHIAEVIKGISPTLYQRAFSQMEKAGHSPGALLTFYRGMISHALLGENVLPRIVLVNIPDPPGIDPTGSPDALAQAAATITDDQWAAIMIQLRQNYSLSKNFHVRKPSSFNPKRGYQHMQNLKHISLVITKSDMFPIIYPPAMYVDSKLMNCKNYLRITEDYLKLLGGKLAYYNTSVTGYSFLRDTMFYPSKCNTLTPINVVEPIFDMLGITKDE
ncbi:MAG: hypothetical protein ACREJ2_16715, partial [Planctomycetota bacterium]